MNRTRKSIIFIAILTFFYGLYYWGIPSLINIPKRMGFIENKIQEKTGYKISVKDPRLKMGLLPSAWFMAENTAILNNDNSKALNLEHSAVKINLLPLIFGKVQIGNFSCDKIDVNLIYDKAGELRLGQYKLEKAPESKMSLNKAYFRIGNYNINLDDQQQNKNIKLKGSYLSLDEFKKNKRLKASTFAELFVGNKSSQIMADIDIKLPLNKITEDQFKVNGRIVNLNLADFSDYASALPNSKIKSLSGIINLVADTTTKPDKHKNIFAKLTVDNLAIMQEDSAESIYCEDRIKIKVDIDTLKNGLNIRNLKLITKGIDLTVNGKAKNIDNKTQDLDMNISINKSRTENFIPLMPGIKSDDIDFYTLKKNFFYGDINGNLSIAGKTDKPMLNGKILVEEGYLNNPVPNGAPKATIKLTFTDDKMNMDIKVPTSPRDAVFVYGDTELYGRKYSDMWIKSTPSIDLKIAQVILNPLHTILNFELGPVPIMDLRGLGNISLHVIGNKENPHCWGEFNFRETLAAFLDIHNLQLKNAIGKLTFDDIDTHFVTQKATLNGQPIIVDGWCSLTGILDFDVITKGQDLGDLIKILKTSPMLIDIQKMVAPITLASGNSDFRLKLTGVVKNVNDFTFNKTVFAKGSISLHSANTTIQGIPLTNLTGKVNFDGLDTDFNINSNLENSKIKLDGKLIDNNANIKVLSDKFVIKDGIKLLNLNFPEKDDVGKIHTSFSANYKGNIEKIDMKNLNISGKIYPTKGQNLSIGNGDYKLSNSRFKTTTLKGTYKLSPYSINLDISNIYSPKQFVNGSFNVQNFNLQNLENFKKIRGVKNINGTVNINGQIKNNGIYADTSINNIGFYYEPQKLHVKVSSGSVQLKNETLVLNKINSMLGEMPVFLNGEIYNISKNPELNLYINAKPTQEFVDQFFNNRAVYPIKLKGDINFSSKVSGTLKAIRNKSQLKLSENASIYYMGATLGSSSLSEKQLSHPVILTVDNILYPNGIKINNLQYDLLLNSQNNRFYTKTQLNAYGNIGFLKNNDINFNNFIIKTQQPTDAKIFNIIFRKPFMKQGMFTSDITINGKASRPLIFGKLKVTSIDIPLFDATIKDIDVNFKHDKIYLQSKGMVLTNNLVMDAVLRNNPKPPFIIENINLKLEDLDLNKITAALQDYNTDNYKNSSSSTSMGNINQIIIKNAEIIAQKIKIKNMNATDFSANIVLDEKMHFNVKNYKFKMADGVINGDIKYNILNNIANLTMNVKNANAQIIAETLFNLKGQIYGSLTGSINLYCNGKTQEICTKTLSGYGDFEVSHGKMPKLGSLEYLLKAGNLVRSGVTGLSINGIIDLITPLKTGEFDSINGHFKIIDGIANNIQIFSAGKDLNMYLNGSYNLNSQIADMNIFGALSKNFTNLFGRIGNASLNTLFNTIPGINASEIPAAFEEDLRKIPNIHNTARMFTVDIYGDINGDNYVKSFKWLK